jgi:glycine betaine/choline ABC-type transport system substrate-binding protein
VEKKWDLVKRYDLSKHRIMDIWEKMNFSDDYAFHLSRMLTTKKNLDQIADEIEHVKFKQTGTEKTQVVDTRVILACSTICMQLVNLG